MSVSVGKNYSEDQLVQIFLDNFHQGGKYYAQIASHQAELRRKGKITDQKFLYISYLQDDYQILTAYQVVVRMVRDQIFSRFADIIHWWYVHLVKCLKNYSLWLGCYFSTTLTYQHKN